MKDREELTTEQKWVNVDRIIERVEYRKKHKLLPHVQSDLEEYVYNTFGKRS